ncbi:pacearchaeosortase [Candidatus Pacearchaeota archaeon]|nr:pacearchaeosortase [Candidatus Pacearchaeota archaeon]
MKDKEMIYLLTRYMTLVLLALFNLAVIYAVFSPITLHLVTLGLPSAILIKGTATIFVQGIYIELIPACIAGAAYYLLFVLNLSTPMKSRKRFYSLLFIILSFLFLNVLRIIIFTHLARQGSQYFDTAHELFWYFGSTILLILIWFANVFLFRIREIPIYTDVMNIVTDITRRS